MKRRFAKILLNPVERAQQRSRLRIPKPHAHVVTSTGKYGAVRTENQAENGTRISGKRPKERPRFRIPQYRPSGAPADNTPAVRGKRYAGHLGSIIGEYPPKFPCAGIPEPQRGVFTRAGERLAVRTKRQTRDRSCVRKDHPQLLPRFGVPHAHRLVLRAGCKHVPVRAKRNTTDFMSMPDESIPLFDRFGIPNLRLIAARTGKRRAIWTEFDVNDIRPMPEGRVFLFARFGIPQPHRPVLTSAGKQTAVRTVCHAQHLSRMFGEQIDLLKRRRIIQPNPNACTLAQRC